MATTTNYGWVTPDDTALVKDGAAAIRTLGTSADTTVYNNDLAAIKKAIVDAKGDIIAATAADTVARLAVGATNGMVLTVDSTEATGLKYALPAAAAPNGYVLFSTTTMTGAATITVSGISDKSSLLVLLSGVGSGVSNAVELEINGTTGNTTNAGIKIESNGDTSVPYSQTAINIFQLSNNGSSVGQGAIWIDGGNSTSAKIYQVIGQSSLSGGTGIEGFTYMGVDTQAATISSIVIKSVSSNFDAGTMRIFAKAV